MSLLLPTPALRPWDTVRQLCNPWWVRRCCWSFRWGWRPPDPLCSLPYAISSACFSFWGPLTSDLRPLVASVVALLQDLAGDLPQLTLSLMGGGGAGGGRHLGVGGPEVVSSSPGLIQRGPSHPSCSQRVPGRPLALPFRVRSGRGRALPHLGWAGLLLPRPPRLPLHPGAGERGTNWGRGRRVGEFD